MCEIIATREREPSNSLLSTKRQENVRARNYVQKGILLATPPVSEYLR